MRQKTRLRPVPAAYRTRTDPLPGYNAIKPAEQLRLDRITGRIRVRLGQYR